MPAHRKAITVLLATLFVYSVLVATHLGEFWPFSIYPMFSQGGKPWSRAVVRVLDEADSVRWAPVPPEALPGRPYPLLESGADHTDLANFVSKTETWDAARVAGLRKLFDDEPAEHTLLVLRANGRITEADSVILSFVPYALLRHDTTMLNPRLSPASEDLR